MLLLLLTGIWKMRIFVQQNEMMKMRNERDENEMKSSDDCCVCYAMFKFILKHLFHIHNDTIHDTSAAPLI